MVKSGLQYPSQLGKILALLQYLLTLRSHYENTSIQKKKKKKGKMDLFKFWNKYGKELRCPNTLGKYSTW